MAFDQNHQEGKLNLGAGLDQVKQWQAELDKATSSIGAAELAAEEEQAEVKLKNLAAQQKVRLKQLDELIALEEEGIRELAKARLTLSNRQFELRKKEIQKEFQLAKDAAEALFKLENKQKPAKKPESSTKKSSSTKDIVEVSRAKPASATKQTDNKTQQDINKLLYSIDDTLSTLQNTTAAIRKQIEEDLLNAQAATTQADSSNKQPNMPVPEVIVDLDATKLSPNITVETPQPSVEPAPVAVEPNVVVEPNTVIEPTPVIVEPMIDPIIVNTQNNSKGPEAKTDNQRTSDVKNSAPELTGLVGSIDKTLATFYNKYLEQREGSSAKADNFANSTQPSITVDIQAAASNKAQPVQADTRSQNNTQTGSTNSTSTPAKTEEAEKKYSSDGSGIKKAELEHVTLDDLLTGQKLNSNYFDSLKEANEKDPILEVLNKIIADAQEDRKQTTETTAKGEKETPAQQVSQTTLDLADAWLKSIKEASEAEAKLQEFEKDLKTNTQLVALQQEQARRQEFYNKERELSENQAKAEANIAYTNAHKTEILAQEEAKLKTAFAEENNKLTGELLKTQAAQEFAFTHEQELREQEGHKLRNEHEKALHTTMLADIAARVKADDIRDKKNLYLSEAHDKLAKGHLEKQNQLALAAIDSEAKADDLLHNKQLYQQEEEAALNKALIDEQNKLTENLYKTETSIAYTQAHEDELRAIEHQKLINQHAADYDKYLKYILAADEKAKDLEHNRTEYLNKELDNLERGHKEEQNKLTKSLIDTEAKGIDLKLNKDRYVAEEAQRLQQQFADKENQLLESRHKREAKIVWLEDESNKKKLIAQNLEDLRSQHAENEIKLREAHNIELARAIQLEQDHAQLLADKIKQLGEEHTKKQNDLNDGLKDADAKKVDLETNGDAYIYEETLALEKAFRDEQNKLTEDEYKRKAQLDYIEANEKKLTEQNLAALRSQHADEEVQRRKEHIKALARSIQLDEDRATLVEDAKKKLAEEHTTKQNDLKQGAIDNDAKAADLIVNREEYVKEARMRLENELAANRNRLTEELINKETQLAFTAANRDELLAQERQQRELGYLDEYNTHLLKAGDYAVSLEEYKADQEKKRHNAAKKEAVNGMVDGLKKFGTGEFSMTDVKQAYGEYMGQRTAELKESGMDEASAELTAQFELLASAAGSLADALDAKVKEISAVQGVIDTRLQGSQANDRDFLGSYWNKLLGDARKIAGASPFIKQEKLVDNMKALVEKGISFDIKQRAFLMTIQEKIANTFDVADGTLLRLIRIQQQDTTAGRLGMESALNSFLNNMYETSEYLENIAKQVRSSLEEMQALMEGAAGAELEFQVQKWMGSMYSVGMSDSAVQGIAQAFGQIASGDVGGLTGSGAGNLIIMAANEAGKSIADILQEGLDAKETNELMQAMVNYLAEIADSSSDSRVVQQQLANVYGLKASDLRAATNLASSVKDISKKDLTYDGMMKQLESMMNTIRFRTSIGEGLTNMWDNVMYSMASTQASNPILYLLPKMANLLKDVTGGEGQGGIALPFLNVYGFGVDLNTTVSDLMLVASMAGTALGALGPAITGLVDLVNPLVGTSMLQRAGIKTSGSGKIPVLARGSAQPLQNLAGASISESGLVGNSSGDDIKNATMQDAEDDKKKQMVEAKDEESADDVATEASLAVVKIYNLLEEVAHGSQSLRVRLVSGNSNGSGSTALGCNCNCNGILNGNESDGQTTNSINAGKYSTDNGNWVLAF